MSLVLLISVLSINPTLKEVSTVAMTLSGSAGLVDDIAKNTLDHSDRLSTGATKTSQISMSLPRKMLTPRNSLRKAPEILPIRRKLSTHPLGIALMQTLSAPGGRAPLEEPSTDKLVVCQNHTDWPYKRYSESRH